MRWEAGKQVNIGFTIAVVALVLSGLFVFQSTRVEIASKKWVAHALEVERKSESLLNNVTDAETGQRGYLLTGRLSYLEPYNEALAKASVEYKELQELVINPNQKTRLIELWPLIEQKFKELESTVVLKRVGKSEAALKIVLTDKGKDLMVQIRDRIRIFRSAEDEILIQRIQLDQSNVQKVNFFIALGGLVALVTLLFSAIKVNRDIESRRLGELARIRANELEDQKRKIQEASRLKGEFLANMSHELRTPLNAIIGFAALMHEGKVGATSADQKEYLGDILTSSRHLLQLVNDVLDLAKVEAGKIDLRPEPFDLAKVIKEVKDILRGLAFEKRIEISDKIDPTLSTVTLDPAKFKQILYNFLSNAIKFTPQNGKVMIRLLPEGKDMFRVEVEDTGIGIDPKDIDRLFVEFQQLDSGMGKKHGGTGLGLALTKRLVEAQGGKIEVQSKSGLGTTFSAVLPRNMKSIDVIPLTANEPLVSHQYPTVLVIEDDTKEREWLVQTLDRAGYFVEGVATGNEAVELCSKKSYALVTLDLLLPDSSGWGILKRIRETPMNKEVPIIVVTVCAESNVGAGFRVHDFLVKPVQEEVLLGSLKRARVVSHGMGPILIVDDDVRLLKVMEEKLKELGYRAICKPTGDEALRLAQEELPAAIVLDLLMPGMSGFEFLDQFRKLPGGVNVPIVVWTSKDLIPAERERLRQTSQAVVLKKHGGTQALIEELKRCLVTHGR